ncbi:MAG: monovalent cation/H(+) antiporter subunit G [Candidatus Cloacimonetes bacterium]|nr:monovalent cation/H(+) antiporter subunit G [Candidatus Cloacimonadota bacterium]
MQIAGAIVSFFGAIFLFLGALGVLRMPDLYNRMQAGTKATTLGSILFMLGLGIGYYNQICICKIILLLLFVIFTNPISSHALARAGHYIGIRLTKKTVLDTLHDAEQEAEL